MEIEELALRIITGDVAAAEDYWERFFSKPRPYQGDREALDVYDNRVREEVKSMAFSFVAECLRRTNRGL